MATLKYRDISGNFITIPTIADTIDGYHLGEAQWAYSNTYNQPTVGQVWYLKIQTSDWNNTSETIYLRGEGNNSAGTVILKTGSRQSAWWGYATNYNGTNINGVKKVVSNSDDVYIKMDSTCTQVVVRTTFSPRISASTDTEGYTNVPSIGGLFGNSITFDAFYGPLNGNAATATKLQTARTISLTGDVTGSGTFDGSGNLSIIATVADNSHNYSAYLQNGGNIPAGVSVNNATTSRSYWVQNTAIDQPNSGDMQGGLIDFDTGSHHQLFFAYNGNASSVQSYVRANVNGVWQPWSKIWQEGNSVTGAVWNDYAECRESDCEDFGYVLMEVGNDSLTKTTERLSHFAGVSSDTWGFSQGETERARTPIAVAGRVLVYPYQGRNNYKPGDCVCAAPGGTVDIMTREEVREWPDRIVGTVSCVPNYEEWGGGEGADRNPVKVNGRIWIKVK